MSAAVQVRNASRDRVLADRADLADWFWPRLRGLLGRTSLAPGEGLVIVPCGSIHMLGMRFAIDVLHLDRDGRILRAVPNLRPWRLGPIVRRSRSVVELPAGTIEASGTQAGDQIEIVPTGASAA
ncbi:MAG: DUF192 domain-containing protein [Chloroflexi bacterium]|nr:DUF192 domain-containing protein [Chloroflexota bacterium]